MNDSIVTDDMEHCLICGSPNVAIHHMIPGSGRRAASDRTGLVCPLCPEHHNMDAKYSVHANSAAMAWEKMYAQAEFMMNAILEGKASSREEAKTLFRKEFGGSYI